MFFPPSQMLPLLLLPLTKATGSLKFRPGGWELSLDPYPAPSPCRPKWWAPSSCVAGLCSDPWLYPHTFLSRPCAHSILPAIGKQMCYFPFYKWENGGSGRYSNLPKVTELLVNRTKVSQNCLLQNFGPCSYPRPKRHLFLKIWVVEEEKNTQRNLLTHL